MPALAAVGGKIERGKKRSGRPLGYYFVQLGSSSLFLSDINKGRWGRDIYWR